MGKPSVLLWHADFSEGLWQMERFCDFQQHRGAQPLAATLLDKLTLLHCGQRPVLLPNQQSQILYSIKVSYLESADAKTKDWWDIWLSGWLPPAIYFQKCSPKPVVLVPCCSLHGLMLGLLLYMKW